jgi:hypothetical protein
MQRLHEWIARLLGTVLQRRTDTDLEEELRLHREHAAADARRRSLAGAADDALRAARIRAGGATQAMDALRDQRGLPWLEDLVSDVRHGLRALRRAPVFASVAILTLALGFGVNTAIFSIVHRVLLRPLAYPRPAQLMSLAAGQQHLQLGSCVACLPAGPERGTANGLKRASPGRSSDCSPACGSPEPPRASSAHPPRCIFPGVGRGGAGPMWLRRIVIFRLKPEATRD